VSTSQANGWARFWAVDLHVHTPGSNDAKPEDFGSPQDIVQQAVNVGLSAIAITDHNTVAWCSQMEDAAAGSGLIILPGFELSTNEGHLLGIWEEGTATSSIEDVLIRVGISRAKFGDLSAVATLPLAGCAAEIHNAHGLAIAAHIDASHGVLQTQVQVHANQLLGDHNISAYEYTLHETPDKVAAKLRGLRHPALVQGSDAYNSAISRHSITGIGKRRTWIKAARPDLCGITYALQDPDLRVRTSDPGCGVHHPSIAAQEISGGFLKDMSLSFSPDLNCFLGGTGTGKSLALEALRFALDQEVDGNIFPSIRTEVTSRLRSALGEGTTVVVHICDGCDMYRVSRTYREQGSTPLIEQKVAEDWIPVDSAVSTIFPIVAFSQGEVLEYARQPVGRVGLVDSGVDLTDVETRISAAEAKHRSNAVALIDKEDEIKGLSEQVAELNSLKTREGDLSAFFDSDLVKEQGKWASEIEVVRQMSAQFDAISISRPVTPNLEAVEFSDKYREHQLRLQIALTRFVACVDAAGEQVTDSLAELQETARDVAKQIDGDFQAFNEQLDKALEASGASSLRAIRRELETVQAKLHSARQAYETLDSEAKPALNALVLERETFLDTLKSARDERRALRRARVDELNIATSGFVRMDIPARGDRAGFRAALDMLKVGSYVRENVLDLMAENMHPFSLVRALWRGDWSLAGNLPDGVTTADLSRLQSNIADRGLAGELFECQLVDTPDVLDVKFRRPEGDGYAKIEDLAHGQKCTAILVILLADGTSPVLIDQPEDALHAPWIEEYLVDRLRALRGNRQYIFATHSPALVVSADSEQLITMRASADAGEIEASGSLERHHLNELALHHLEGGKVPFMRRFQKLESSLDDV